MLLDEIVKRISSRRFPTNLKGKSKRFLDLAHPRPEIATMTLLKNQDLKKVLDLGLMTLSKTTQKNKKTQIGLNQTQNWLN